MDEIVNINIKKNKKIFFYLNRMYASIYTDVGFLRSEKGFETYPTHRQDSANKWII